MPRKPLLILLLGAPLIFIVFPSLGIAGAIALENRDDFCASCHTEPEVSYYQRSLGPGSDLASAHASSDVRCIDCHSGAGLPGRWLSIRQGAQDLAAYLSGDYRQPAETQNPLGDRVCLKCHLPVDMAAGASSADLSSSHYHLAAYLGEWLAREPDRRGVCARCHLSHRQGGNASLHFTLSAVSSAACERCHQALSGWPALSEP